jgi:hypothetical protein
MQRISGAASRWRATYSPPEPLLCSWREFRQLWSTNASVRRGHGDGRTPVAAWSSATAGIFPLRGHWPLPPTPRTASPPVQSLPWAALQLFASLHTKSASQTRSHSAPMILSHVTLPQQEETLGVHVATLKVMGTVSLC